MKPSDRIIRKGDYYEMEVIEDGFYSTKVSKKEESQSSIQQPNENILTELPPFSAARANYFFEQPRAYSNAGPDQLLHELQDILREDKIADEDKQEVLKLIRQVKILKEQPLVTIVDKKEEKIKQKQQSSFKKIELRAKIDLKSIEDKVIELEKFAYPEITKLEHQLEILLGEKKAAQTVSLPKDDRNKEDIENLFATFNAITYINDIRGLANKVHGNNAKYVEVANWTNHIESVIAFHTDFDAELKEDELLLKKLEEGWKQNVATVRSVIASIKKESEK